MRDTAPLAPPHDPVGRIRPPFIRPVLAPRTTTQPAHSLGKFCPPRFCSRCDATLSGDRQMTHFADVAPSGPNCSEAHPPRRAVRGGLFLSWSDKSRLRFLREAFFVAFLRRELYENESEHVQTSERPGRSVSARSKMRQSAPAGDEDLSPPGMDHFF